jgi:hypothetical protein
VQALVGAAWRLLNNHNNLIRTLNLSQFGQFDLLPSAEFELIRHTLHCSPCLQSSALAFYCWCFHCYGDARQQIHTSDTMNDKLHEFCYYDKFCMSKLHQMEYNTGRTKDIFKIPESSKKTEFANYAHMYRHIRTFERYM